MQKMHILRGRRIAIWGLSYKADTDDLRDAPALDVLEFLREERAEVVVYDPLVKKVPAKYHCRVASSALEAVDGADALIIMNYQEVHNVMNKPAYLFDARNATRPLNLQTIGFRTTYIGC